jgi:hypothetical protein
VCVPGRVIRRGRSDVRTLSAPSSGGQRVNVPGGRIQVARLEALTDNAPLRRRAPSPPTVATRPRVAARSPMSGASWRATEAAERARETAHPVPSGNTALPRHYALRRSSRRKRVEVPAVRSGHESEARTDSVSHWRGPSPPSVAMHPRVAAPPLGGASKFATLENASVEHAPSVRFVELGHVPVDEVDGGASGSSDSGMRRSFRTEMVHSVSNVCPLEETPGQVLVLLCYKYRSWWVCQHERPVG